MNPSQSKEANHDCSNCSGIKYVCSGDALVLELEPKWLRKFEKNLIRFWCSSGVSLPSIIVSMAQTGFKNLPLVWSEKNRFCSHSATGASICLTFPGGSSRRYKISLLQNSSTAKFSSHCALSLDKNK